MFFEQQIRILERFLKDHVTGLDLKSGINYILKYSQTGNPVSQKYVPLCTLFATSSYVPYSRFCRSFKDKCPPSGAKTQVKYVNPGTF